MGDGTGPFRGPEHQVEVLAPVHLGSEAPDLLDQSAADDGQVSEVRIGQEQIRAPVRFEVGEAALAALVELVLVRIDQI